MRLVLNLVMRLEPVYDDCDKDILFKTSILPRLKITSNIDPLDFELNVNNILRIGPKSLIFRLFKQKSFGIITAIGEL